MAKAKPFGKQNVSSFIMGKEPDKDDKKKGKKGKGGKKGK